MPDKHNMNRKVVPVLEERAAILKRKVLTDGVRVRTAVHEREAIVDEPLFSEEVEVERVLLDRWVDAPIPVRQDGDTSLWLVGMRVRGRRGKKEGTDR